jgi:hypothetical protein
MSMKVRARVMGVVVSSLLVSSLLMVSALAIAQDGPPSGKVWVESTSVALGIGVSWGDGKLTVQGKDHVFTVKGLSVIDLGVSKVTANGEVFNLKKLTDFNGNYVAGTAGATVGGGAGAVIMKNQNGVVMKLTSTSQGVQLTLAGSGVDIQLKN